MITTAVPFTQFLRPNGVRRAIEFKCPPAVATLATAIIAAGGRFEIEELSTGEISMTVECRHWETEDRGPVAHEVCLNGPPVLDAVDRLIREAASRLL